MEDRQKIGVFLIVVGIPLLYYIIVGLPLILMGIILLKPQKKPGSGDEREQRRKTVLGFGIGVLVTGLIFLIGGILFGVYSKWTGSLAAFGWLIPIIIGVILVVIGPLITVVSLRYKD